MFVQVEEFNTDEINKLAPHVQPNNVFDIIPGFCLKCGSYHDLESSSAAADKARMCIRRYNTVWKSGSYLSKLPECLFFMFTMHAGVLTVFLTDYRMQ